MEMRLKNKIAIITGGGSGIGKASAHLFSQEGAKVVIAQRTESSGQEVASTINSAGGEAVFVRTDVTIASDVQHLISETIRQFGTVDILFNNAGMTKRCGIEEMEEALWDYTFALNVKSIFLATKYAVPHMKKLGGSIINNASIMGIRPRMCFSAYVSSKGAAIMLTKALALELASYNIRVNCINPAGTDTPQCRAAVEGTPVTWEEFKAGLEKSIPLGHLGQPIDSANAALFLASDESSMITGSCINVDGGRGV